MTRTSSKKLRNHENTEITTQRFHHHPLTCFFEPYFGLQKFCHEVSGPRLTCVQHMTVVWPSCKHMDKLCHTETVIFHQLFLWEGAKNTHCLWPSEHTKRIFSCFSLGLFQKSPNGFYRLQNKNKMNLKKKKIHLYHKFNRSFQYKN